MRVCLFGAAPDTGNQGVNALCQAVVAGLAQLRPDVQMTVFDHGRGERHESWQLGGVPIQLQRIGAMHSSRLYRPEALWNVRVRGWLSLPRSPALAAIDSADVVLDLSAGDSFTDLYGRRRYDAVVLPKRIVLERGRPLVLLPQTYGPFASPARRAEARRLLEQCAMAWARDPRGADVLEDLLGPGRDLGRYPQSVDLAFSIPPRAPETPREELERYFTDSDAPVVACNVSGLLWNQKELAARSYGLQVDYRGLLEGLCRRFLGEGHARILLVPHVLVSRDRPESDLRACEELKARLDNEGVEVLSTPLDQSELRHWLEQTEFFVGARMHSVIAALCSGTPSAVLAYSDKSLGLFQGLGSVASAIDLRACETDAASEMLWAQWLERAGLRKRLSDILPELRQQALEPLRRIAAGSATSSAQVSV